MFGNTINRFYYRNGPTGPTGTPGASILDSYETYAQLIAAHPTGTRGDAYLVGGVLYVWDEATSAWKEMGSLIGPTGPTGSPGASILDSYETLADLIAAHPTGTRGDAYLVGGVLHVWDEATSAWKEVGSLIGPTGPTGSPGASILDSYDTLADLIAAHPNGTRGDAYLVGGVLYVWDEATVAWKEMGSLIGPTGPQGSTGPTGPIGLSGDDGNDGEDGIIGTIDGIVENTGALPTTGIEQGTIFYVEESGELYVWDADAGEWKLLSIAQGPRGATGPTGPTGPTGADGLMGPIIGVVATAAQLPTSGVEQGDMYYVEGDGVYVWDNVNGWTALGMIQGPRGVAGPAGPTGPAGSNAAAVTIIPFASQQAPYLHANVSGAPTNTALIGYGYMEYSGGLANVAMDFDMNDGSFSLTPHENRQLAFSLPYDMILESIYITVGNYGTFLAPTAGALVYPYVQIYAAVAGTNTFFPIENAFAKPVTGLDTQSAQPGTMLAASKSGLNTVLPAGTRIAIGCLMEITGDNQARDYYLYFSGGIGMSRRVG